MIIYPRRIQFEDHRLDPHTSFAFKEFRVSHFPFNWHYHPEIELTMIVKGRGLRFVADSIQDYREGDLCLLGSNTPHSWQSQPVARQSVRSLVILFRAEFLGEQLLRIPEARKIKALLDRSRRGLCIVGKTREVISQQMLQMLDQPRGSFQHVLSLLSMLSKISESIRDCVPLGTCEIDPVFNKEAHSRLGAVLRSINADAEEFPSQQEAARLARLSPPAFSRFFKRSVGKTYVAYLNELRINRACRALIETDQNITEIAYGSGFNNLSNFNRRFLDLKRMTPRTYRRLAQNSSSKALQKAEWNKVYTKIPFYHGEG